MRTTQCLFSTATALQRVFVSPIEPLKLRTTQRLPLPFSSSHTPKSATLLQRRTVVTSAPADKRRSPRNEEITSRTIVVVADDKSLSPPQSVRNVLSRLDRERFTLVQVLPPQNGEPALCKILDKKKDYADSKLRAKNAKKSAAAPTKEMELNWAIEGGDFLHRMRKFKGFLEKGMKVDVTIAPRRRGKQATPEEALGMLKDLKKVVEETEGARQSSPMTGTVGKEVRLSFEGKLVKEVKEVKVKEGGEGVAKAGAAAA